MMEEFKERHKNALGAGVLLGVVVVPELFCDPEFELEFELDTYMQLPPPQLQPAYP